MKMAAARCPMVAGGKGKRGEGLDPTAQYEQVPYGGCGPPGRSQRQPRPNRTDNDHNGCEVSSIEELLLFSKMGPSRYCDGGAKIN